MGASDRIGVDRDKPRRKARDIAESFVACRVCGTYVAEHNPQRCEREDCPYR